MTRIINNFLLVTITFLSIISCNVNKARVDNSLKKFFDEHKVDGCFTMLNNADGEILVYNMALDTTRFTPASTFKIVNSLIALETGKVSDENEIIRWDGVTRKNAD